MNAPSPPLFRKLVWLTLFRLVTVTVLLGGTAAVAWGAPGELAQTAVPLFRIVLVTYAASLAFALGLRWTAGLGLLALAQIALDVAVAAAVVALTGRGESVFVFMYLLAIVNGSVLLFRRGAAVAAALALLAHVAVVLAGSSRPPGATLFVQAMAFVATAALASYLAEQLRRTGERLEAREGDLAVITALHESIVQSVTSGIVTLDGAGRITFVNRAGEGILGVPANGAVGERATRWFPLPAGEGGVRDETELAHPRGQRLQVGYSRFPLVGRGGAEMGGAIIFQDLTRLRAMEAEVQRSERLADLGRVAAGLAHELRNPLASMAGSVELLRGSPGLREGDARLMDIVLREAARLESLVAAFLAFSRPAPPRLERVELERVISETLEVFANDPSAGRVEVRRALEHAEASCDASQLRQVLWNLLANAAHAAGEGGTVTVACGAEPGGDRAWLEVRDDGPGMSPAELGQLFTPFFTTKAGGTGLGLATVQRIVDAHGGTVSVDSAPGRGAIFTVRLPATGAAAPG